MTGDQSDPPEVPEVPLCDWSALVSTLPPPSWAERRAQRERNAAQWERRAQEKCRAQEERRAMWDDVADGLFWVAYIFIALPMTVFFVWQLTKALLLWE